MTNPTPATTQPTAPKLSTTRAGLTHDAQHAFRTAN
jgi:hypothetical protein